MSIPPQGSVEFVDPKPALTNHVASCIVLHKPSGTIHVDDTIGYTTNPNNKLRALGLKHDTMRLHGGINRGYLTDPQMFYSWLVKLCDEWVRTTLTPLIE